MSGIIKKYFKYETLSIKGPDADMISMVDQLNLMILFNIIYLIRRYI